MPADWEAVRREFTSLANWTFLDTATFGQLPRRAVEAVRNHFAHRDETACADFLSWFDDADRLRALLARFLDCDAGDIAFTSGAAPALSLLAGGLDWKPGDRIVTLTGEFPNNIYAPALLERAGVEFVETPWESFHDAITPRTRLVAISSVNYTSGFRPPLAGLSRFLHERGVLFYVDGTQSLGALRFNVAEVRPDLLAAHGYKWLLCPNGIGFMYVAPALRERLMPNVIGWRSHRGWRDVDYLHHGAPVFKDTAEKYEGGMLATSLLCAMEASIGLMFEAGLEEIERRVLTLAEDCRKVLRRHGAGLLSDRFPYFDSPIVAARFEGRDASALARALREERVLVSARHGNLRVSTHFYNNEADLEALDRGLARLL